MFKSPVAALAGHAILIAAIAAGLHAAIFSLRPATSGGAGLRASPSPSPSALASASASAPASSLRRIAGPYLAEAVRVVDGDTFEARLRVWFNQDVTLLVRLDGIDAPELRGRCAQESRLAAQARDALAEILASGEITLRDLRADKYNGRAVARASVRERSGGGDDIGALLVAGGYARPYDGRARSPWCGTAARLAESRRVR